MVAACKVTAGLVIPPRLAVIFVEPVPAAPPVAIPATTLGAVPAPVPMALFTFAVVEDIVATAVLELTQVTIVVMLAAEPSE